jgi:hypothetical protein
MLTLDPTSAGVVAGVYSALLIALAIHRPGSPRKNIPQWGLVLILVVEMMRILAVFCTATSIYLCLKIVCGIEVTHGVEVFVSITLGFLWFAVISWIADYAAPSIRGLLRGDS